MAEATLLGMPLELLVYIIATYLSTAELGALRLTSKYLETALFDTFAKEFFSKKQFMLSTPSLGVLVEISKHTALAPFLKHVIIGLEHYVPASQWQRWDSLNHCQAYRDGWADQYTLTTTGRDRQLLAEAFRNLPSLETIGIRDYSAYGRVRDRGRWRSYGAPTADREAGMPLCGTSSEFATRTYAMVLQAMADANRLIPNIEVILRTPGFGLSDFAFYLPPGSLPLDPVLQGLRSLLLTLNCSEHFPIASPVLLSPAHQVQTGQQHIPYLLESFLQRTDALTHLRLNFQTNNKAQATHTLERLSLTNNLLPKIERLELGMGRVTPDLLLQVVTRFPQLHHLGLWKFELEHSLLPRWVDSEGRYNPWPPLLRLLSTSTRVTLTSVSLGCLMQRGQMDLACRVHLPGNKAMVECEGNIKALLPQLADEIKVEWPPKHPVQSTHEDDPEDDDGNEDEDGDEDVDEDEEMGDSNPDEDHASDENGGDA